MHDHHAQFIIVHNYIATSGATAGNGDTAHGDLINDHGPIFSSLFEVSGAVQSPVKF